MNEESAYLLKVLKGFIWGECPGAFRGDWAKLISLSHIHSVTGIVGYMVKRFPDETNAEVSGILWKQCLHSIAMFSLRAEQMKALIQKMNEREIAHLLLKGYVLKDYYPVPELRTFGDIDFLIHPEDRCKSDDLMTEEGFERKADWGSVHNYVRAAEYYEIHTDVMEVNVSDKADYKGYFRHIWEHARLVDGHTWELAPEYHFLYLLTHIAKHINGAGAGIRMYMDIAVFIRHFGQELDWDYVQRELRTLCFSDFANTVLTVVQRYFGVESPISLRGMDKALLDDFMEFTMEAGVFGKAGRDLGLIHLKCQNRNEENVYRTRTFLRRLFPSAVSLEMAYPYLKGRHWLLPVIWLRRLLRIRNHWRRNLKEAHSIMSTDKEEVLKLKRIYKGIGL